MKKIYRATIKSSFIALSILLVSCTTDVFEPKEEPGPNESTNGIPNDFDFSTVTNRQLVVNVLDEYDGRFYYTVEVYNKNPNTDESAKILMGSKTNGNVPISTELVYPKTTNVLYVVITDPFGHKGLYAYDIKDMSGTISLNPGKDEAPKTKAGGLEIKDNVDFSIPSSAVEIKNNGTKLAVGGVYKITEDDYDGEIKFPDGAFTLYVSKKLRLNDNNSNKNKQYLLQAGGKIYVTSTGVVEPNGGQDIDLELAGTAALYNAGSITVNSIDLAKDDNVTNSILFNKGTIKVNQLNTNGAQIYNHCLIHAGSIDMMAAGSSIYLYAGAILVDKALTMKGGVSASSLYLSAKTIFKAKTITFEGNTTLAIYGDENGANLSKQDFPLLHIQDPVSGGFANQIQRAVEVFGNLSSSYQMFSPAYQTVGDKPNAMIEASSCNGDNAYNPGGGTEGDKDSEYEETNTPSYTYMFEDNWPGFGDYDMNDLVMDVNIANKIKGENATHVTIKTTLRAVGATKDLYAYAQIEAEGANNIIVPLILDQEAHQALKADPKAILNTSVYNCENQTFTNTIPLTGVKGRVHVKNLNVFIVWGNPAVAKRNEIHLPGFKGTSQAAPTGKKGYQYDGSAEGANPDLDNMMWGLMVPTDDFISYPREGVAIATAYPGFGEWALQGGNETVGEWYKNGDVNKLYQGKAPNVVK